MKKKYLTLLVFVLSLKTFAQTFNVQSANNAIYTNDIKNAKRYIDLASENDATSDDGKMWYVRGKVYLALAKDSALTLTDPDAAIKAATSFINCLKKDFKDTYHYKDSCYARAWIAGLVMYNKAAAAYSADDLHRAEKLYKSIADIFPYDKENNLKRNNITIGILNKNTFMVYYKAKDYDNAKIYLQKLIDVKYNDPTIYGYMTKILVEQKDTTKALEYIAMGRTAFDENTALANQEMGLYLAMGKINVLIGKMTEAIALAPDNEALYYKRGVLNENQKLIDSAASDYRKALELSPNYFEASFGLGSLLYNEAATLANTAKDIKNNDEFAKAKAKFEKKFLEAQPYLEAAQDLNTKKTDDDKNNYIITLNCLKQLYARTNQMDKYEKVKAELEKK